MMNSRDRLYFKIEETSLSFRVQLMKLVFIPLMDPTYAHLAILPFVTSIMLMINHYFISTIFWNYKKGNKEKATVDLYIIMYYQNYINKQNCWDQKGTHSFHKAYISIIKIVNSSSFLENYSNLRYCHNSCI